MNFTNHVFNFHSFLNRIHKCSFNSIEDDSADYDDDDDHEAEGVGKDGGPKTGDGGEERTGDGDFLPVFGTRGACYLRSSVCVGLGLVVAFLADFEEWVGFATHLRPPDFKVAGKGACADLSEAVGFG